MGTGTEARQMSTILVEVCERITALCRERQEALAVFPPWFGTKCPEKALSVGWKAIDVHVREFRIQAGVKDVNGCLIGTQRRRPARVVQKRIKVAQSGLTRCLINQRLKNRIVDQRRRLRKCRIRRSKGKECRQSNETAHQEGLLLDGPTSKDEISITNV